MTLDNHEWDPDFGQPGMGDCDSGQSRIGPLTLDNQEWDPVTLDNQEWAPVTLENGSQVSTADVEDALSIAAFNDDHPQRPSNYNLNED